jgi:hypothetical protein
VVLAGAVRRPLRLTATTSSTVRIQIVGAIMPQGVLVNYVTAPANQPHTFGNQLYTWDTSDNVVPWSKLPTASAAVASDSTSSTQPLSFDYEDKGYIFGYGVADLATSVCATVYVPRGATADPARWEYTSVDANVVYADSAVVQVKYNVLPAYLPLTQHNWVGVWLGSSVPFQGDALGTAAIPSDAEQGYAVISQLSLTINSTYSVGYFMVEPATGRTALAAQCTFTLGSS